MVFVSTYDDAKADHNSEKVRTTNRDSGIQPLDSGAHQLDTGANRYTGWDQSLPKGMYGVFGTGSANNTIFNPANSLNGSGLKYYIAGENGAPLKNVTNSPATNGTHRPDALQLIAYKNQTSTIWSTKPSLLDLSKKNVFSAWLWLDANNAYGDGITFALQNDGLPGTDGPGADVVGGGTNAGQALGMAPPVESGGWGGANTSDPNSSFYDNAVHNAFDIEFDHVPNVDTNGNDFDEELRGQISNGNRDDDHIATIYTASAKEGTFYNGSRFREKHNNVSVFHNIYGDGKWHHFTFIYNPPLKVGAAGAEGQATATYRFNDENFDPASGKTTPASQENGDQIFIQNDFPIDTSVFFESNTDSQGRNRINATPDDPQVRWGFTGANGSNWQNSSFILETAPGYVSPEVTPTAIDEDKKDADGNPLKINTDYPMGATQTGNAPDKSTETHVNSGDTIDYSYEGKVVSGVHPWTNIHATFNVGKNLYYIPGSLTVNGESVDDSHFTSDGQGAYTLSDTLEDLSLGKGNTDDVKFKVEALNNDKNADENGNIQPEETDYQSSTFNSEDGNGVADSLAFKYLIDASEGPRIHVSTPDGTVINDKHNLDDITGFVNSSHGVKDGSWNATLNGQAVNVTLDADPNDASDTTHFPGGKDGVWTHVPWHVSLKDFPASAIKLGNNTFVISCQDENGTESNQVTINLVYDGILGMSANPNSSFKDSTLNKSQEPIPRNNDWNVSVTSSDVQWQLTATATPMKREDQKLNESYTFVDSNGNNVDWTQNPATVASGGPEDNTTTDVISDAWRNYNGTQPNELGIGPRLVAFNSSDEGTYSSTVTWTLTRSV